MKTNLNRLPTGEVKAAENLVRARRKQAALKVKRIWKTACGAMEDTPEPREAWNLGEQWRRAQTEP